MSSRGSARRPCSSANERGIANNSFDEGVAPFGQERAASFAHGTCLPCGGVCVVMPSGGGNAQVSVPLPAVVSCDKGDFKVRKPNVKGIMQAKKASVDVRSIAAPASTVSVVNHALPPAKPAGKSYQGGAAAAEVAQLLRDEANVL